MAENFAATFADLAGVRPVGDGKYESISPPERMGNNANIAYGGCALAVVLMAAHQSVKPTYRFYSALGTYLAPSLTDRKFFCSVRIIRDTITFATRQVEVSQVLDNGQTRVVMFVIVDFQTPEKGTLLEYSTEPSLPPLSVDKLPTLDESRQKMVDDKILPRKIAEMHKVVFGLMMRHFESRPHPESVFTQSMSGMLKNVKTTQDDRKLTSKVSSDYYRTKEDLKTPAGNIAALGFLLDGALSFVPLTHSHLFLDDAGACSSLEFAMRVFTNDVNLRKWHLREMGTIAGGNGRTYTEGRLWNDEGVLMASMTQQSILRPPPKPKAKAAL
jgi:acyl-CoA thioesterase II